MAAFDCSGDAQPDLFLAGGTAPATLWRNDSIDGLAFHKIDSGAELTGVTGAWPLDFDSDGQTDLAVMRQGENVLLRGLGACRFERANEAWGFDGGQAWSTAFAATWEAGQSLPTLAVGNYIDPGEEAFPGGPAPTTGCTGQRGRATARRLHSALILRAVDPLHRLEPQRPPGPAGVERPRILQGRAGTALASGPRPATPALYRGRGLAAPADLGHGHCQP
ncbi:FG-GAP repeat domain-containing protein [Gemmobacter lanyuensis]